MPRIVADENIPFLKGALEPFAEMIYLPDREITHESLRDADGLIVRTRTICNEQLLEGNSVRFIATATIGFDHINTAYCDRHGIDWNHAPGCNASGVEQYIACALAKLGKEHHWDFRKMTFGIIGVGHVGRRVDKLAQILGMKVLLYDPPREESEGSKEFSHLDEVLAESDIITLHVPLNREGRYPTFHLAGEDFFRNLKKRTVFINTSRGLVADVTALKRAIQRGSISDSVLDVWVGEPEPDPELLCMATIATPHIAGYSTEGKALGAAMCVRAASKHFNFGIDKWEPASLPAPVNPVIRIDGTGKSPVDIIDEACTASYDISLDDRLLRQLPSSFEQLRNDYPVRREFSAFRILPSNVAADILRTLQSLAFKVD